VPHFKKHRDKELDRRVKKSQIQDSKDARHDLLTALRVAMKKMLEETIHLTEVNMKEFRKDRNARMAQKREKMERKFRMEIAKQ